MKKVENKSDLRFTLTLFIEQRCPNWLNMPLTSQLFRVANSREK